MNCPGCGATLGRFAAHADTSEHIDTIRCTRTGVKYLLQQDIPQHPTAAGSKANKRRKSRRPLVIAQRRAERINAAAKAQDSKVRRRAEAAA